MNLHRWLLFMTKINSFITIAKSFSFSADIFSSFSYPFYNTIHKHPGIYSHTYTLSTPTYTCRDKLTVTCIYIYIYMLRLDAYMSISPVGWDCRIHRLLLCRVVRPYSNECPGYDTKQSDNEVPVILEPWGMWITPSLPSLPGPLWPKVVAT